MNFNYTKLDIVNSLKEVGISKGDSIFIHSNIGFFGKLDGASCKEEYYNIFKNAIFDVIGNEGTIIVPTFSYSYCNRKVFCKFTTPSVCGLLSEMLREDREALRSEDPNFSVCAIGKKAERYTNNIGNHPFGYNSFFDKFYNDNGMICNLNFDAGSTFVHYVEKMLNVDYRYDKPFEGFSNVNGELIKNTYYHFVYDKDIIEDTPTMIKFDKEARKIGLLKSANLGKGQVVSISARDTFELIKTKLIEEQYFLRIGKDESN